MALSKIDVANMLTGEVPNDNVANLPASKLEDDINFRNLVINGDMSIAQRATSAATLGHATYSSVDRWTQNRTGTLAFTGERSTDAPDGFDYSYKISCTTAEASLAASSRMMPLTRIEDSNLGYLKFGTSSAVDLTMSFHVKSNKTGTYQINLWHNNVSGYISGTYAISSADTWEKKTIVFKGDQGTAMGNDAGIALQLEFVLAGGSNYTGGTLVPNTTTTYPSYVANTRATAQTVNLADSTSNTWQITGLQLEVGSAASDFEFLPVDINLKRCERYFQKTYSIGNFAGSTGEGGTLWDSGSSDSAGNQSHLYNFKTRMRASPTVTGYDRSGNSGQFNYYRSGSSSTGSFNTHMRGDASISYYTATGANFTAATTAGFLILEAEL